MGFLRWDRHTDTHTDTQTDIASFRLNRPRGRFSENLMFHVSKKGFTSEVAFNINSVVFDLKTVYIQTRRHRQKENAKALPKSFFLVFVNVILLVEVCYQIIIYPICLS